MFSFRTEVEYHLANDHQPTTAPPRAASKADAVDADPRHDEPATATARAGA
jgi:hypothetical protein